MRQIRKSYAAERLRLVAELGNFSDHVMPLGGLFSESRKVTFAEQIIDSRRRVDYVQLLQQRQLDPASTDPLSDAFHPLKAAILHRDAGNLDEAVWLIFLFVHFGRHKTGAWRYIRDVYGQLGGADRWTWAETSADPRAFRTWLDKNVEEIKGAPGPKGFGNHRKYESLAAWSTKGTGQVVATYVDWVLEVGSSHSQRFATLRGLDKFQRFDELDRSLRVVVRFGRIARFDYSTMLMKMGIVDIAPAHAYLKGATGPLFGTKVLFHGNKHSTISSANKLQDLASELCQALSITPDVYEDAVCNWQKSPVTYVPFLS